MRGRPPKPSAEKKLNGNPGRRPLNEQEPAATGDPIKPSWLDEEASSFWDSVVPRLVTMGVAKEADSELLAAMSRWWSIWRSCDKLLVGGILEWKVVCTASAAWKQFSAIASKFGLNPSDRQRLKVTPKPVAKNAYEAMMQDREGRN